MKNGPESSAKSPEEIYNIRNLTLERLKTLLEDRREAAELEREVYGSVGRERKALIKSLEYEILGRSK